MRFYPPNAPVPEELRTDEFTLRPLTPAHVELDHTTLMTSKKMLRLWSGNPEDGWPDDDFSVEQNMEDMEWHYSDHLKRIAFTFTVLNPAEDEVIGCIYIVPFEPLMEANPQLTELIQDDAALIRFWAVEPRLGDGLDARILQSMVRWFNEEWAFAQTYFHVYQQFNQQIEMMEANGLERVGPLKVGGRGGLHWLYTHPNRG